MKKIALISLFCLSQSSFLYSAAPKGLALLLPNALVRQPSHVFHVSHKEKRVEGGQQAVVQSAGQEYYDEMQCFNGRLDEAQPEEVRREKQERKAKTNLIDLWLNGVKENNCKNQLSDINYEPLRKRLTETNTAEVQEQIKGFLEELLEIPEFTDYHPLLQKMKSNNESKKLTEYEKPLIHLFAIHISGEPVETRKAQLLETLKIIQAKQKEDKGEWA